MFANTRRALVIKGRRGHQYHARTEFPNSTRRAIYKRPEVPMKNDPTAHRNPNEYGNRETNRIGLAWHNRVMGRGEYKTWPWRSWHDDPVREHRAEPPSRTFSARMPNPATGMPLWDHYADSGLDYRLSDDAPVHQLIPILNIFVGKQWSMAELGGFFDVLVAEGWTTVESLDASIDLVRAWSEHCAVLPPGFIEHVALLSRDVVALNKKKAHRRAQHRAGVLRTNSMTQYFAMPWTVGPAMPTTLNQPGGLDARGDFSEMRSGIKLHPEYVPDGYRTRNALPV